MKLLLASSTRIVLAGLAAAGCLATASFAAPAAESVWLSALDLSKMTAGWGKPQADKSVTGAPLAIGGQPFEHGVGTHARSTLWVDLARGSDRFVARVGINDTANGPGSVIFKIIGDGRPLYDSGVIRKGDAARPVDVAVAGLQTLLLQVADAGNGTDFDHAVWAEARFVVSGAKPRAIDRPVPKEEAAQLTPKPGPAPRLNGPRVCGGRPGHPFLYRIPAQGDRPMRFSAQGLPKTLQLDPDSGIIRGTVPARGEYKITLRARSPHGQSSRPFKLVSGDTLALTPPMGWNHWYAHYDRITDAMMREAADVMIRTGMADVGYQYVNIDDCWMNAPKHTDPKRVGPLRDPQGNLLPNQYFPDMRGLADYIHAQGLKAGLYTSPGPLTCGGFAGAYQHEAQDARLFAAWGYDFLKYDWCSYGDIAKGDTSLAAFQKPYRQMGDLLQQQDRDIVFNLCQYGMGDVWKWGADVGGHCWRTAGDLGFELDRIFNVALANAQHRAWSKPGAWNDPDYVQIGFIGAANGMGLPRPCPLTPSEQYAFMSLWCLMAAPLFYSGDMSQLDPFTLNVLCNPEVIDIDQDPLGQCARVIPVLEDSALAAAAQPGGTPPVSVTPRVAEDVFLMVKDLDDGSKAVGLCNQGEFPRTVTARWSDLGIKGRQTVRDLWRQKDLGRFEGSFAAPVPRHGVVLVRIATKPRR